MYAPCEKIKLRKFKIPNQHNETKFDFVLNSFVKQEHKVLLDLFTVTENGKRKSKQCTHNAFLDK